MRKPMSLNQFKELLVHINKFHKLGVGAFTVIFTVCVIVGKSLDKKEHDFIGEDEIKDQKEEAEAVRKSPNEWDCEQ
ncbi:hypothetical protein [Enterococcus faecalis]|uniref:hypothetical protein n=1 Tax=Enterococcus faecalis TaxID=1351 RepID=UPI0025B16617|nr:hypothetical protein [Enterococcus faecalis]MDN3168392.1 hypothetical protein [Enterococcus faecalis]